MDEGWTRFVFDSFQVPFRSVTDSQVKAGDLPYDVIVLPADSEASIVRGLSAERYPADISGGIGDAGAENLKKFVENGGKLVCFDDSCELVMKRFGVPVRNVLSGINRRDFYNPGSIVKLSVNTRHPLAKGLREETPAYFTNSSAFEVAADANVRIVAKYADENALISGWMLGEKRINGKAALVETDLGKGKLIMFAFRPQHRGQTFGTFPFVFNALER